MARTRLSVGLRAALGVQVPDTESARSVRERPDNPDVFGPATSGMGVIP